MPERELQQAPGLAEVHVGTPMLVVLEWVGCHHDPWLQTCHRPGSMALHEALAHGSASGAMPVTRTSVMGRRLEFPAVRDLRRQLQAASA